MSAEMAGQMMNEHFQRPYAEVEAEVAAMDKMLKDRYSVPIAPRERERVLVDCIADLRLRVRALEEQLKGQK